MTEEQRQQYLKNNFAQQNPVHARVAMTPISEKDTIYEQTQKATIESSILRGIQSTPQTKYGTSEEHKRSQNFSSSGFSGTDGDERKLTGSGYYKFQQDQDEEDEDADFYEDDFEDVRL